jgi:hypothetical protein
MQAPSVLAKQSLKTLKKQRWVEPEALNVAPELVGQPLASPARRAIAMGIDLLAVALISGAQDLWLFAGLALVVLQLRNQRRGKGNKELLGWLLAALLVGLAISEARSLWAERFDAAPAAALAADDAPAVPADPAKAPAAGSDAERIAQLERELAQARAARPATLREQADKLAESLAARLGWGIVYFSLLPAWWGGQTLGKRMLGLKVVELTGKPLTVMRSLKRYGGYAAGMATGGLGFVQVLWDPNRQGLQDKAAHTVVIDLRAPRLSVPEPAQTQDVD